MSPDRNMSIMVLTSSTATVLAVTAMILARSVEAKVVRPLNGSQDVTSGPPPLVSGPSGLLSGPPENPEYLKPWKERTERVVENEEELLINECCSRGMILNDTLECETVEKKDEIVAIANSIAVDASMKPAKLNSDQMVLSEYFAHICSGDKSEVVYWPKGGQLKTHYINHKNGELLVVNNTMKKFPSTTYCVDEAKHEGELSYALMMCPCTVSTCIQKCCPETMHFDTIIEQCVPSNPNISTFQPTLQRMKNDIQNEHFFLTYGIPQCEGQLMMLLLNMTKVYPQESGYLMLDDEENGQHQFYERGKYCLDIFSSQAAFAPKLGGFICRDGFTNYTYQEVSDKNLLEVVPFSVYAPRKIERLEEATEDKESADSTEFKGAEYKTEDVDRGIEVVIKSFDSRSAAVQTAVFWEMVVVLVFVLLCKK